MTTSSARGFSVFAGILGGAALGLFAYRFGVLPLAWKAKGAFLFPGVAAGLGVAAHSVLKARGEGSASKPLIALGALLGAAAAFGLAFLAVPTLGRARLTTTSLPGFAIDLPAGDNDSPKFQDYGLGKVMIKNVAGQGGVIAVSWEGGEPSREDLELAAKALGPAMGATGEAAVVTMKGPRGTAVDTIILDSDKSPMRLSFLPCGTRRVMVATMVGSETEALHGRVLATFVCKPDPARETITPGVVPLIAELPGWFATERDANQVVLSDGAGMILLKTINSPTKGVEDMVVPMFNAIGWKLAITGRVGDRTLISGTIEGELVHGWVRSVSCITQAVVVVAIAVDLAGADQLATQLATARCARPGETPTAWPDPPADLPLDEGTPDEAAADPAAP